MENFNLCGNKMYVMKKVVVVFMVLSLVVGLLVISTLSVQKKVTNYLLIQSFI